MSRSNAILTNKLVQVNSAYRSSNSASNSDFSVDFRTVDLDNVTQVTMVKASLPRLFPNIWSVNNQIAIEHPAGVNNLYTVPPAYYNVTTLTAALNTATAPIFVTWAFNTVTNKFTATYSSVTTVTLLSNSALSTIGPYIGLTSDVILGAPSDLPSQPQLSGPDDVYINSQIVASNSCIAASAILSSQTETNISTIPFLGSISFADVPYGFVGRFDSSNLNICHIDFPYQASMRKINVKLTDFLGNVILLPDNCYFDMILQFTMRN